MTCAAGAADQPEDCAALPRFRPLPFHPCVHPEAHTQVARLHLPVAARCNIQCAFCQRDPAGDGPGAALAVIGPRAALERARDFVDRYGPDSVVGVAGPGDPLANPETFATLALLHEHLPATRTCLCTNGLALPAALPALVRLGLGHLTVTINAVAPRTAARIQPLVRDAGRVLHGEEGAGLLLSRQREGLHAAAQAGIFVKVNMVVVPSINAPEAEAVARQAAALGAGIFNLMPLIPRAGLAGERPPSPAEMNELRARCARILPVFALCRQCRADAAGIPGKEKCVCPSPAAA